MTPIEESKILNDFFNSLRSVGASYAEKELSDHTIRKIDEVKSSFEIISASGAKFTSELTKLSKECNWDLKQLLHDILKYPTITPRVKRLDGSLHYVFKVSVKQPIDIKLKQELIRLTNKISTPSKKHELFDLIDKEESLLYVASELVNCMDLTGKERKRAREIFAGFY